LDLPHADIHTLLKISNQSLLLGAQSAAISERAMVRLDGKRVGLDVSPFHKVAIV
jgi:hypothetical protein